MSSNNTINLIEEELRVKTPRRVRLTKAGTNLRNAGIGLSTSMIFLWGCLTVASLSKLIRLKDSGKVTIAHVTKKYVVHSKHDTYYIDFSFKPNNLSSPEPSANSSPTLPPIQSSPEFNHGKFPPTPPPIASSFGGKDYKGEAIVNKSQYNSMQIGLGIAITYLPSDPSATQLGVVDGKMIQDKALVLGAIGLMVFGVFGALFGSIFWMLYNHKRLLTTGVATTAYIDSCKPILPNLSDSAVKVNYKYSSPNVGDLTGSVIIRPHDVALLLNPIYATSGYDSKANNFITVLYDPNRPQTSRPYRTMTYMVELS